MEHRYVEARFVNGASVNEMYGELGDGSVIAVFQYDEHARAFAEKMAVDGKRPDACWWIVTDHRTGQVWVYRSKPAEKKP